MKHRCPTCARMTHLDICNTSYGQKKVRESNWQFDSRPQKVRHLPYSFVYRWHATHRWKALDEGYNFGFRPHPNLRFAQEVMNSQSCGSPNLNNFGTPTWESRDERPFECHSHMEVQSILYGGRWGLPLSPGHGESCESEVACGSS